MRKEQSKKIYVNGFLSKILHISFSHQFLQICRALLQASLCYKSLEKIQNVSSFCYFVVGLRTGSYTSSWDSNRTCYFKSCYVGLIAENLLFNCGQVLWVYFVSYKEKAIWHHFFFKVHTLGNIIQVSPTIYIYTYIYFRFYPITYFQTFKEINTHFKIVLNIHNRIKFYKKKKKPISKICTQKLRNVP